MKSQSVTIQMKATEQYFPVVLFIMLYKVILTFESVDENLHWNESCWEVLCKVVLPKFKPVWMKFLNVTIQMKATELCFLVVLWSCGYVFLLRWFSPFKSAEKILKCEHLNEIHWTLPFPEVLFNF